MTSPMAIAPEPGVAKPDPILVARRRATPFGGLLAVDVDHLEVQRNTITALIGPNGAGKTTLFNVLTGFDRADGGSWSFDGTELRGLARLPDRARGHGPHVPAHEGAGRADRARQHAARRAEPVGRASRLRAARGSWRTQEREDDAPRRTTLLDDFGLADKQHDLAGTMSGGQRKLLEMARALMVDPQLVMLDEPMAGVNPALVQSLLDHVQRLRDEGRTVVFVEHDMDVVMSISDWVVCMAEGRVIAEGPPETDRHQRGASSTRISVAHHGDATAKARSEPARSARDRRRRLPARRRHPERLQPRRERGRDRRHHRAERRRQVDAVKAMFGLVPIRAGSRAACAATTSPGAARTSSSNAASATCRRCSNVFASADDRRQPADGLLPAAARDFHERRDNVIGLLPRLGERLHQRAGSLSGGERQMLAMARALMMEPSVLLLDEPSAGLSPMMQDDVFDRIAASTTSACRC